jgi:hypothetical protein
VGEFHGALRQERIVCPLRQSLTIPDWFPKELERRARELHARALSRNPEQAAVVARVVTDARMKRVWQEIGKRRRSPLDARVHLHPATVPSTQDGDDAQHKAMEALLAFAAMIVGTRPSSADHELQIDRLRQDAADFRASDGSRRTAKLAAALDQAREAYGKKNDLETSQHERRVVDELAAFMQATFGSPMHGLTATVASVVLQHEVSRSKVREWSRPKPRPTKATMGKRHRK